MGRRRGDLRPTPSAARGFGNASDIEEEAIVHFTRPYSLEPALLGTSHAVEIGGAMARLVLPTAPEGPGVIRMIGPTRRSRELSRPIEWGVSGDVKAAILVISAEAAVRSKAQLGAREWCIRLDDWLRTIVGGHPHTWVQAEAIEWLGKAPPEAGLDVDYHYAEPIAPDVWAHALEHASSQSDVPLARRLLAEAESALALGGPRRALLDAATAAELALVSGVTALLDRATEDDRRTVARGATLGSLARIATRIGLRLDPGLQKGLVEARNRAIHQGEVRDIGIAMKQARLLVRRFEPLPPCCEGS